MTIKASLWVRLQEWLSRHLFPAQHEHMAHLVSDVIRLEKDNETLRGEKVAFTTSVVPGSNSVTYQVEQNR